MVECLDRKLLGKRDTECFLGEKDPLYGSNEAIGSHLICHVAFCQTKVSDLHMTARIQQHILLTKTEALRRDLSPLVIANTKAGRFMHPLEQAAVTLQCNSFSIQDGLDSKDIAPLRANNCLSEFDSKSSL